LEGEKELLVHPAGIQRSKDFFKEGKKSKLTITETFAMKEFLGC